MKTTLPSIGGLVLCGGDSRRMGQSKAWLALNSQTMLDRVVVTVSNLTSEIVVAARSTQSLPPVSSHVRYAYDKPNHAGPLAGIAAGMTLLAPTCDAVVVVACDHPLVSVSFLQTMIGALGEVAAIVPQYEDRTYPLLAVYRTSTLQALLSQLNNGNYRAMDFVRGSQAKILDVSALALSKIDLMSLKNVNTPADWQQIQAFARNT